VVFNIRNARDRISEMIMHLREIIQEVISVIPITKRREKGMILKFIAYWIPLPIIGIINGVIREFGYRRFVNELLAHQISTITLIVLFGIYTWLICHVLRIELLGQAIMLGVVWLVLTVMFEFLFGHYVMGNPWSKLFHDYNLLEGRLWILILVWISIAPYIIYKIRS